MKKKFIILLSLITFVFANEFSNMSTQELVSIMGYVKDAKQVQFLRELKTRESFMDEKTKKIYIENLKKYYGKR